MWRSFVAVFRKEFLHIFRDAGTLRLALALPVLQLVLFGFIDQTCTTSRRWSSIRTARSRAALFRSKLRGDAGRSRSSRVTGSPDQARADDPRRAARASASSFRPTSATSACAAIGRRSWC